MPTIIPLIGFLAFLCWILLWLLPRINRHAPNIVSASLTKLTQLYVVSGTPTEIASLPAGSAVKLNVKGASVVVKREGAAPNIIVKANFAGNWRNSEGRISQIEAGSSAAVLASGAPFKLTKIVSLIHEPVDPSRVSLVGGDVLVDGQKVTVMFSGDELEIIVPETHRGDLVILNEGTDEVTIGSWVGGKVQLTSTGQADFAGGELTELEAFSVTMEGSGATRFDKVEAGEVEISHQGGNFEVPTVTSSRSFKLKVEGNGDVTISDALTVEEATIDLPDGSNCNVTTGPVTFKNLTVNSQGSGNVEFQSLAGGDFKGDFASSSSLTVNDTITAGSYDFTCEGNGDFTANGGDLTATTSLSVRLTDGSNCNVSLAKIDSPKIDLDSLGSGSFEIQAISGGACKASFAKSSSLSVNDTISVESYDFISYGNGDFSAGGDLTASVSAAINLTAASNCNVTLPRIDAPKIAIESLGSGDVEIADFKGDSFTGVFDSNSNFTVENTLSVSRASLEMRATGDASMGELKAPEVSLLTGPESNSNVTIGNLDSESASITNEGSGTVEVEDGSGAHLTLTTHNGGDITISGDFSSVSTNKSGNGTISL